MERVDVERMHSLQLRHQEEERGASPRQLAVRFRRQFHASGLGPAGLQLPLRFNGREMNALHLGDQRAVFRRAVGPNGGAPCDVRRAWVTVWGLQQGLRRPLVPRGTAQDGAVHRFGNPPETRGQPRERHLESRRRQENPRPLETAPRDRF
ncbi:hypothetical protein M885DRAFT_180570 [Pelagophyceae sp. CCMP2097]|nr:hypothetical protein M885DRAFT_180570 [Pelagophyceae sp. CCMP2097]